MPFPRKYAGRSSLPQPITGPLGVIRLDSEQREIVDRLVTGIFLDMQDKPITEILASCFISGMKMAIDSRSEE